MSDDLTDRPDRSPADTTNPPSKRVVAAILAILLGGLGVHKFYLGKTVPGIITIVACFGLGGLIPIIEGIIYLTKTDEEFVRTYQLGDKQWF